MTQVQDESGDLAEIRLGDQVRAFRAELPAWRATLEALRAPLAGSHPTPEAAEQLRHEVHRLGSTAAALGFTALSEAALQVELLLRAAEGAHGGVLESPPGLDQALARLLTAADIDTLDPDARPQPRPSSDPVSPHAMRAERLIYLLEEDQAQAEALAVQIGHFGYAVRVFTSLGQAADSVRRWAPTAMLMDLSFCEDQAAGADEAATLSVEGARPFPVLFVSTFDDLSARLRAVRAGGVGFFVKPLDVPVLIDGLDQLTGQEPPEPHRILVVDDDRIQANLNAAHLRRAGMEVRVVTDPLQTIEALIDFQPELVLLDMYMPICTGMELATVMRQMEAFVGLPIVFLSAETDRDTQLAAVGLGGDDFLVKPIKPDHLISAVMSRTERYRKLRSVMMRDGLTSLFNHSTITDRLELEIHRARRQNTSLAAAMLDLDQFKHINDSHGHPVGDRVLKSLARLLTQRVRSTDIVGRYGGEEFLVILPDTPVEGASLLIDELRLAFSKLRLRGAGGQTFSATFSAGIAGFPACADAATLTDEADKALYQAKSGGRNRVVAAPA
jgi:diguanylate cyclase (GGDEF)-like protein